MPDEPIKKNIVRPVLIAALMCDVAVTDPSSGKKTLVGIFDKIFTAEVPTTRSSFFYFKVTNAIGDYTLEIQQILSKTREIVGKVDGRTVLSDKLSISDHFAFMQNVRYPHFGRYEFQILFDGYVLGQSTIDVINVATLK